MRELQAARRSSVLEVVPNTLAAAERAIDADDALWDAAAARAAATPGAPPPDGRARLITVATRPHVITRVNKAFASLCGYDADEAVGRTLRLIQGPATDADAVADLLDDVRARVPSSMIVINYRKDGTRFVNYLRAFPLAASGDDQDDYSFFLGELEKLDDAAVRAVAAGA